MIKNNYDNYHFFTYKEQILDIDLNDIFTKSNYSNYGLKYPKTHKSGFRYANALYDIIHQNTMFILEKDGIKYEIIEEGFPQDIPWCNHTFDNVDDLEKWLKESNNED